MGKSGCGSIIAHIHHSVSPRDEAQRADLTVRFRARMWAPRPETRLLADALPRVLASVTDYAELLAALRKRAAQLGITRVEIDEIAGLSPGHSSKLLAAEPTKNLGLKSLALLLGALAVRIALIEDEPMLRRISSRIHHRSRGAGQPHRSRQARVNGAAQRGPV